MIYAFIPIYIGHNDNNTKLRYNNDCFARRIRYHTSPICEKIEREEHGIIPITSWKWTLRTAIEQKCRMPDVSNIIQAGSEFFYLSFLNNSINDNNDDFYIDCIRYLFNDSYLLFLCFL